MFGLLDRDIFYIRKALSEFKEIDKAVVFGSRAMGNYKKGSDVDIAISGEKITNTILYELTDKLNEVYPIPYFFDIVVYNNITNKKLKEHIDNEGIVIYLDK